MSIKLVEPYSVTRARNWVRDSLQSHGEQCILLSMHHPRDHAQACPNCADDVYDSGENDCPICWGSGYIGGVKQARRAWALFSDRKNTEKYSSRGTWAADAREIQTEAFPELLEHDFAVRVRQWDINNIPLEIEGFYAIGEVTVDSMRTGNQFGQWREDIVGQRAPITKLSNGVGITSYPIVGQTFPEVTWDNTIPTVSSVPIPSADQQVIFYPQQPSFTATLGDGVTTVFPIRHGLHNRSVVPVVFRVSTGEVVDANVFIVDGDNITVSFETAPSTGEYQLVVKG